MIGKPGLKIVDTGMGVRFAYSLLDILTNQHGSQGGIKSWKHLLAVWGAVLLAVLLVVGLLFSLLGCCAQGEVTVSIDAPDEVAEGSDFIARANITRVSDLDAANYDVTFDPTVLEVTDVTAGLIGGTTVAVDIWRVISPGTLRVVNNVPGLSGVSGSGYLAEIHFHVVVPAGDTSDINLSNGVLSDNTANEIPATWVGDSAHVNTPSMPNSQSTLLKRWLVARDWLLPRN